MLPVFAALVAAPVLAGTAVVSSRGELVTARFTQVTAAEAFAALHDATGVETVLPEGLRQKMLTYTVEGVALQPAVKRILEVLGLTDFVLVFEADGRAERLVVHASAAALRASGTAALASPARAPAAIQAPAPEPAPVAPLAAAEKKELEAPIEEKMTPEEEEAIVEERARMANEIFGVTPAVAGEKPWSPSGRR